MSEGLPATLAALNKLVAQIKGYMTAMPASDRFLSPVIDWHHPQDYDQTTIQGLSKFLHHVEKEQAIIESLCKPASQPAEYTSNLISLEGVWGAFLRAPKPVTAIWQAIYKVPGFENGNGSMKIDVVGDGGGEWIKVSTIKESRLLDEFREQDSYINSDWESDSSDTAPNLTNSLLTNARILAAAAAQYPRTPGLAPPRLRYILTRLPATGHSDSRIGETITEMQRLGIHVDFCDSQWAIPEPRHIPPLQPAEDIVLDVSIMIALCCDSTHHPLPADEYELESRFRTMKLASSPEGSDGPADNRLVLGNYTNATRDLRDQLRCEIRRPLITEMIHRLNGRTVRFWITREVRDRLPKLVDVIGGERERYRAQAMFNANNFWAGSRWEGKVSENLRDFRVRVLEDEPSWTAEGVSPQHERILSTPFDSAVAHVCREMLSSSEDTPTETPATGYPPDTDGQAMQHRPTGKPKNMRVSRNPQRARVGTRFTNSKLPSGHTLRTLLAGIAGGMTVLTNNRGAVLKVLREEGVIEGIPFAYAEEGTKEDGQDAHRARIWIVNPSSLAEWRRCQVEKANTELIEQYPGARIERIV